MNITQSQNEKVLACLKLEKNYLSGKQPDAPIFAAWNSVPDPYSGCGSHPDIVEYLWNRIGKVLPTDCRGLVYGTPALVQPKSGVIFALGKGTQYNLRLPGLLAATALKEGAKTHIDWTSGGHTDIHKDYGEDWVFGAFLPNELIWCKHVYELFDHIT